MIPAQQFKRHRKGFTPLDHAKVLYQLGRVTSGRTQLLCTLYVLSETRGAPSQPRETRPLTTADFATFSYEVNVRTVEMALKTLCDRTVLRRKYAGKRGFHKYSAPISRWPKLFSARSSA